MTSSYLKALPRTWLWGLKEKIRVGSVKVLVAVTIWFSGVGRDEEFGGGNSTRADFVPGRSVGVEQADFGFVFAGGAVGGVVDLEVEPSAPGEEFGGVFGEDDVAPAGDHSGEIAGEAGEVLGATVGISW